MDRWHYLALLAACLLVTSPLEVGLRARVYRQPVRVAVTVTPVLAVFGGWDLLAHAYGHWSFSDQYTLGIRVADLPVEEWLFFLVVPVCAVLTYEAVGRILDWRASGLAAPAADADAWEAERA